MRIRLDILKGNKGTVIDLDDYRITNGRHNGIMKVQESFEIEISVLERAIKEFKEKQ